MLPEPESPHVGRKLLQGLEGGGVRGGTVEGTAGQEDST